MYAFKLNSYLQKEFQDNYHKPIGPCEYVPYIQRSPPDQVSSIGLLLLKPPWELHRLRAAGNALASGSTVNTMLSSSHPRSGRGCLKQLEWRAIVISEYHAHGPGVMVHEVTLNLCHFESFVSHSRFLSASNSCVKRSVRKSMVCPWKVGIVFSV